MLGRERRDVLRDLCDHQRIGLRRDVRAAEMLGQRDDAERDRHPGLDPRRGVLPVRIALDPDQFGRSAADVEQDGAPPLRVEQRRAADHGQARLRSRGRSLRAGCRSRRPPGRESRRHWSPRGRLRSRSAAAAWPSCDWILSRQMLRAAMARSIAASLMQPVAEMPSPEPDDARERVDHAKAVAGRAGDQQAAIVGAEIERGIDAGSSSGGRRWARCAGTPPAATDPWQVPARPKAVAKPRVIVHPKCLSAARSGRRGISVHGNFSSAEGTAQQPCTWDHAQSGVVVRDRCVISGRSRENRAKAGHFRDFPMQDQPSSASLENAIALQKYGVGQPVRRKEDDTLVRGKGKYTDDFNLPGQAYAWIVRSSHAHGIIQRHRHRSRQGDAGRARRLDRRRPRRRRLRPLHLRPAAEEPRRHAAAADQPPGAGDRQGALRRRSRRLRGRRDAGAGARCRRSRRARHRAAARRDRAPRKRPSPARRSSTTTSPTTSRSITTMATPPRSTPRSPVPRMSTKLDIVNTRVAVVAMEPRAALARLRQGERALHHAGSDPGRFRQPRDAGEDILNVPNDKVRISHRQCRRLVRHEERQLSRIYLHPACGEGAGPPGEMDRRALDQLPVRQPWPRAADPLRTGARCRRQIPRRARFTATAISAPTSPAWRRARCRSTSPRTSPASTARRCSASTSRCVLTNTTLMGAYRGAGRPEANYYMERLIDRAADEMGINRADPAQAQFHQAGADAVRGRLRRHL